MFQNGSYYHPKLGTWYGLTSSSNAFIHRLHIVFDQPKNEILLRCNVYSEPLHFILICLYAIKSIYKYVNNLKCPPSNWHLR